MKERTIDQLRKEADKILERVGIERDTLRELISDLEDIAESLDEAENSLDYGIDLLEQAADELSKYL